MFSGDFYNLPNPPESHPGQQLLYENMTMMALFRIPVLGQLWDGPVGTVRVM
jgi:hypothetical protein